jgi:flavin reductase (DIM6/NTAB) family NADH-FMN oxidoreductase RutF
MLGIFQSTTLSKVNIITLCFEMYCSYKPPMMAFSIMHGAFSYALLEQAKECVLSVPGESLAKETLFCGLKSGSDVDKVRECGFKLIESEKISVPGISSAIANVELSLVNTIKTGDHLTGIGQVLRFGVNRENSENCLLSVGPNTAGYRVLARRGIHRIATVEGSV